MSFKERYKKYKNLYNNLKYGGSETKSEDDIDLTKYGLQNLKIDNLTIRERPTTGQFKSLGSFPIVWQLLEEGFNIQDGHLYKGEVKLEGYPVITTPNGWSTTPDGLMQYYLYHLNINYFYQWLKLVEIPTILRLITDFPHMVSEEGRLQIPGRQNLLGQGGASVEESIRFIAKSLGDFFILYFSKDKQINENYKIIEKNFKELKENLFDNVHEQTDQKIEEIWSFIENQEVDNNVIIKELNEKAEFLAEHLGSRTLKDLDEIKELKKTIEQQSKIISHQSKTIEKQGNEIDIIHQKLNTIILSSGNKSHKKYKNPFDS